jgi:hypothetical protein
MKDNLQKILDLNEEILNDMHDGEYDYDNKYDNGSSLEITKNPNITNFLSSLYELAISFLPHDRYLFKLEILEKEAKNEFEKNIFDARSSYKFTSTKKEIITEIKSIKKMVHKCITERVKLSKYLIAYLDELETYFKEETYVPENIPSLAFFSDKAIPPTQLMTEIEKEAAINATLHFKRSKSPKSKSKSKSKGGNNTRRQNK